MSDSNYFTDHFLIAMPGLDDPNFSHTVTYICEHNADGAMGIVINRPSELTLRAVLEHVGVEQFTGQGLEQPVFSGGPVQPEHGFVIHTPHGHWDSTLQVNEQVAVTTSKDILGAIGAGSGPEHFLLALGYAGWGPGQLEQEMADNAWLSGPADLKILFELPADQRWAAAAALLGVDLSLLSSEVGHA